MNTAPAPWREKILKADNECSTEDDFQHFLSYSGLRSGENLLRIAFYAGAGKVLCESCRGTGCIDTPTSDSDPCCPDCDGEGVIA